MLFRSQNQYDFVLLWRARQINFKAIEVAAHIRSIDVSNRRIQFGTGGTHFFGGGHNSLAVTKQFTHRIAPRGMPQGTMFQFARCTDNSALAKAVNMFSIATEPVFVLFLGPGALGVP